MTTTGNTPPDRVIVILDSTVELPAFAFFQPVRVRITKEIGTIIAMKYEGRWLYQLRDLTRFTANWWEPEQLRSLRRNR